MSLSLLSVVLCAGAASAGASHSLVERVKNGPAADIIRESYRCLELGEESEDEAAKLSLYARGRELAEHALEQDAGNADAHFALFANWGRWLQIDGWLKNSYRLPRLWGEINRALELDPDHPDALAAKGGLLLQLPRFLGGDGAKAEPLLARSIELDTQAVGARLELAERYRQTERSAAASDLATTALRLATEQQKPHLVRRASVMLYELALRQTEAKR